jgi:hypothetical protein
MSSDAETALEEQLRRELSPIETLMRLRNSLDAAELRTPEEADARPYAIDLIDALLSVLKRLPAIK